MSRRKNKTTFQKVWYFLWEEDSLLSWVVNVVLAFILIKFIVFPGLSFALGTTHPVVAVVSGSMEHGIRNGAVCGVYPHEYQNNYDGWWDTCGGFYEPINITKESFSSFSFRNGFNKGDIIVLKGIEPENIKIGDVIVYQGSKKDPIIHRVIARWEEEGELHFSTKGDHNVALVTDDVNIHERYVIGKAVFKIPWFGYIKIWFVDATQFFGLTILQKLFSA